MTVLISEYVSLRYSQNSGAFGGAIHKSAFLVSYCKKIYKRIAIDKDSLRSH